MCYSIPNTYDPLLSNNNSQKMEIKYRETQAAAVAYLSRYLSTYEPSQCLWLGQAGGQDRWEVSMQINVGHLIARLIFLRSWTTHCKFAERGGQIHTYYYYLWRSRLVIPLFKRWPYRMLACLCTPKKIWRIYQRWEMTRRSTVTVCIANMTVGIRWGGFK